ncbi:MAG: MerR family transcriptional regulator [Rhizobiaceae bacterium]
MNHDFTIQQLADAAQLTRYQVEAWISRGHFKPENPVEPGKARKYTYHDAIKLALLAEFSRLGLSATVASMHTAHPFGYQDADSLLVICQGPVRVSDAIEVVDQDGEIDHTFRRITRPSELWRIVEDPDVRSFAAVNIGHAERRVKKTLGIA